MEKNAKKIKKNQLYIEINLHISDFFCIFAHFFEGNMSVYQVKAKKNYEAAVHLVAKNESDNLYIPSAHLAYYSAFMIMKYALANFNSISYDQQDQITGSSASHTLLFLSFMDEIKKRVALGDANDYMVNYNRMQLIRQKADYKTDKSGLTHIVLKENVDRAKTFYNNVATLYKFNQL